MRDEILAFELTGLGAVRVQGADAERFLQGQLSGDVRRLTPERSQLSGLHNPQGRAVALLRLVRLGADDILAVLPRELAPAVTARLGRYVLRAKVKLSDESDRWRVHGVLAPDPATATQAVGFAVPEQLHEQAQVGDAFVVRTGHPSSRWTILTPADSRPPLADLPSGNPDIWRRLDIAEGWPQVYAATSEAFVAQMLNLDAIGAVAFDKGCYTGQEVIARAHYRGRVKRRMQRLRSRTDCNFSPGDSGTLADGRSFRVVDAVRLDDGRCEFLAVAPLTSAERESEEAGIGTASGVPVIDAETLDLPYSILE